MNRQASGVFIDRCVKEHLYFSRQGFFNMKSSCPVVVGQGRFQRAHECHCMGCENLVLRHGFHGGTVRQAPQHGVFEKRGTFTGLQNVHHPCTEGVRVLRLAPVGR